MEITILAHHLHNPRRANLTIIVERKVSRRPPCLKILPSLHKVYTQRNYIMFEEDKIVGEATLLEKENFIIFIFFFYYALEK